jgi:carbon storage regulator CsrA
MLILSRRETESVYLETDNGVVRVSVELVDGRQVKLGFDAPQSVKINRQELYWCEPDPIPG